MKHWITLCGELYLKRLFIYLLLIYLSILQPLRNCQGFQHHIPLRDTALSV